MLLLSLALSLAAPDHGRDIVPILTKYCVECHAGKEPDGEFALDTLASLLAGGSKGKAITPGKADASPLVLRMEGKLKPVMPPKRSKQPTPAEIALVRAWVEGGAKASAPAAVVTLAPIVPTVKAATPVTALAYSPDGKTLAASGRAAVLLIDAATGGLVAKLPTAGDRVSAVVFSPKGDRLAAASSTSGKVHEARLWTRTDKGFAGAGVAVIKHDDVIQSLAFSPDGSLLASGGYDRLVRVYDVAKSAERAPLRDHSDSVYGVSFAPGGKLLASVGADRAVKVWDVAGGKRLYTLGESTDWVYAVAWSPDGKHLAAGGADKSVRVWRADADGGKVTHSVFAHEGAVLRVAYTADGKTLYTVGEDRAVKAWTAATMSEAKVFAKRAETVLALAVRPDAAAFAVGVYDGTAEVIDAKTGAVVRKVMPVARPAPVATSMNRTDAARGSSVGLIVSGDHLDGATAETTVAGAEVSIRASEEKLLTLTLKVPAATPAGEYALTVVRDGARAKPLTFRVDPSAAQAEAEPNDSPRTAQAITLPATMVGKVGRAGESDWFRFRVKAGEQVGVQSLLPVNPKFAVVLMLVDADGRTIAESSDGSLGYTTDRETTLSLGVRDAEYRGGGDFSYRVAVGNVPVVTAVHPLGGRRGTTVSVEVSGVNLGVVGPVSVNIPATAAVGSRVEVPVTTPWGKPAGAASLVVGDVPEVTTGDVPFPGVANGRILKDGESDLWRVNGKRGGRMILEVSASRIGSRLDSTIEILDAEKKPLPRATLRATARTFVTFRDHDSEKPGIRIEAWSDLAINDYLLVGTELTRILALPRNPDDDCQFYQHKGKRVGYLGTTPVHQSMNTPMYKVAIHPPGSTFPPNGLPTTTLYWRNDDGTDTGRDSRLVFDPPADGVYYVRVGDSHGEGSPRHGYRLTLREPKPDFAVTASVAGAIQPGTGVPVRVTLERLDEFDGGVELSLAGLPQGFAAPASNIGAGETATAFTLFAEPSAVAPKGPTMLTLSAKGVIAGKPVTRTAAVKLPALGKGGKLATTTDVTAMDIVRGKESRIVVTIERKDGFKGRVPIDVQGLPFGVRVLDVGLNGILITEAETRRAVTLYCEPWVTPTEHPIVITANAAGADVAARSVLLRVK